VKLAQAITGAPRKLLYAHAMTLGVDAPADDDSLG
jgi:16S rRNA (cytidine1402-2'-O)-methyltransferase